MKNSNQTKVQALKENQLVVTIPKQLSAAMGISKGTILEWSVLAKQKLEVKFYEATDSRREKTAQK